MILIGVMLAGAPDLSHHDAFEVGFAGGKPLQVI
jgi:hypothetical protein